MIKALQNNTALQIMLILAVTALLWGRSLVAPPALEAPDGSGVLYCLLCRWIAGVPRVAVILAILLTLAEGVALNLILSDIGLVSQNSLLPTLLFVAATSAGAATLTPMLIVCGLMIVCLDQLMLRGTLLTIPPVKECRATALIAISTMFYIPAAALWLSYLFIAANYRLYSWRDWALMLLGLAAPYILLLTVLYMTTGIGPWWETTAEAFLGFWHFGTVTFNLSVFGSMVLTAILLWGLLRVNTKLNEHTIVWQKNASTVMLVTIGGIVMMLFSTPLPVNMQFFALPFTFCTSRLLLDPMQKASFGNHKRRLWMYDLLLILILFAAFIC